jgi:hypothetical protein
MARNPSEWGTGYRQFKENTKDLYSDLNIEDLVGVIAKKLPKMPKGQREEVKTLHGKYVDTLKKNERALGEQVGYLDQIGKGMDALKKAKDKEGKNEIEKERKKLEETYNQVKGNIINISKGLYAILEPEIDSFAGLINGLYAKIGLGTNRFTKCSEILKNYYLTNKDINAIKKEIEEARQKQPQQQQAQQATA